MISLVEASCKFRDRRVAAIRETEGAILGIRCFTDICRQLRSGWNLAPPLYPVVPRCLKECLSRCFVFRDGDEDEDRLGLVAWRGWAPSTGFPGAFALMWDTWLHVEAGRLRLLLIGVRVRLFKSPTLRSLQAYRLTGRSTD